MKPMLTTVGTSRLPSVLRRTPFQTQFMFPPVCIANLVTITFMWTTNELIYLIKHDHDQPIFKVINVQKVEDVVKLPLMSLKLLGIKLHDKSPV